MKRRLFLQQAGLLAGAAPFMAPHLAAQSPASASNRGTRGRPGPNDRLQIAAIGAGGRAAADIAGVDTEDIVAIADVDQNFLDKARTQYPKARPYHDFRVMLEAESNRIDAVVIGTPDHTHACAAAMALKLGKHLYCEKPLTHTIHEARVLTQLARKHNVVTQMGTQIHAGENYRRVVEWIQSGIIGPVEEVDIWVNIGHRYSGGIFTQEPAPPRHLDWDLWLGPAPKRPYSEGVHPFNWRRFWDYGNGRLGDFGCHYMDLVHWALNLTHAERVHAHGPELDPVSPPEWLRVDFFYPARDNQPPVTLRWFGSRRPKRLEALRDADGQPIDWNSGHLFVGKNGMIVSDYSRHMLLPAQRFADATTPDPTIPRSIGHHQEWVRAIKEGGQPTCHFDYAGPLTETVLLGSAAYRAGQDLQWDSAKAQIANVDNNEDLTHKEYRKGWHL